MILNNERGSTLIENVIAIFALTILSAMVVSTFFGGLAVYTKSFTEYTRINEVYSDIELMEDSTVTSTNIKEQAGSISFEYAGNTIVIEGTYIYDDEGEKIGEFVTE